MRKKVTALVMSGIMLGAILPGVASAQTGLAQVESLLAQIKALQAQIASLTQQKQQLQATTTQTVVEILQGMQPGTEGEQVKLLQTLLSTDPELYPEGKITGYYGPATRRAIERFQRRSGLETVGFVGPRTRAELNKWIKQQFKQVEDLEDELEDDALEEIEDLFGSSTSSSGNPCAIPAIPTGTPGIIKDGKVKIIQTGNVYIYKDGKHQIIITPNSYIEKDGKKKLVITPGMRLEKDGKWSSATPCNGTGTTTPPSTGSDTTAPVISSIVSSPAQTSAGVTWSTNELANGKVYYGTASPLNLATASSVSESNWWSQWNTNHSVNLTGLAASTTYYFVVESKDKKGNTATSTERSFKTAATPDTTAPTLSAISVTNVGTSTARIAWSTNEMSNSAVYFGTTTPLNTGSAQSKTDASMVTSHVIELTGLAPGATYYFKVESKDAAMNGALSSETSFSTAALPADTTAPTLSAIVATPAATTASITWTTNEAATSKVYYGTSTPLAIGTANSVSDGALVSSHAVSLTGLTASTTYYIVIESKDSTNNTGTSSETSFLTL